ncbi:hypothetical protein LK13_16955 [Paenibacillus polymyxa]|uniref:restriction endonuclease subunit S n=1 Tax=Paenibacillus polymyxa TaxID=1406 RepID=UPI00042EDF9E|nr:restriction endonuclease subunit S [Paenibacillus polymyxa]AHM64468.1 restriction endonuclease S subunit [Paenibacillus polymyxa SQR-21]AIY10125.1 hypothetical protein LK13_16955 [Paenibacillus polymyxa]
MTENNQNLVPEIRFNGFTNAWEQRRLGEIYKERKERGIDSLPILSVSIHHGVSDEELDGHMLGKEVRRSDDKSLYKRVYAGDLVINMMRAWQGAIGVVKSDGMVSPAYITAISNSHVYPLFMDFYLRRDEPIIQMDNLSQGVTDFRKRLYWDSFIDITCKLPSLLEQERISDFFHTFNNIITLHKRKLDGLRELKKGYLQQMFPQAGEREPRVRFAGFSGEWQERKLGELFKERNERSSEGELISVTINSGVIKASELERKDNSSEDKSNYKKVEVGDIAYNSMRMWQGASGISNYAGILSPAYTVIIPNEGVDSLFISYMFKLTRMIEIFQSFSQGLTSDTWNLKFPLLKEIYVTVPCSNEQAAISDFFRIIDEQITAQAIKLEQLGQLKAAYLQRMFI